MSGERVLDIVDLEVEYRDRDRDRWIPAVSGIDLDVNAGEVVALVGESGSGKSTTAHAVLGLLPGSARIVRGTIDVAGTRVTSLSERQLESLRGREVGLVPQDPTVSLNPVRRVGEQVAEALWTHGSVKRTAARVRALELLEEAGIPDAARRAAQYPHELSGGLRQRALIAIALACRPKLLIADEPTSALDVTVQKQILDGLSELTEKQGTAVLLVTHDLGVAADRADRVAVMRGGRVVEFGAASNVLRAPTHEYTRELIDLVPRVVADRPVRAPSDSGTTLDRNAEPLLRVSAAVKDYPGARVRGRREQVRVLDGVSLDIPASTTLGVVGESGSGKTTLARLAAGLLPRTSGNVTLDGRDLDDWQRSNRHELRRRVQYVYQNPYSSLDPRYTVERILAEPLEGFRVPTPRGRQTAVLELLDSVLLSRSLLQRHPTELSGGQRQRIAIARALAAEPELLVLDEPVSALDVSVQAQILDLLAELQRERGLTYLFISHDLAVVHSVADHVLVLQNGRAVESGPTEQIFTNPTSDYTRALLAAIPGARLETQEPTPRSTRLEKEPA